MDIIVMGVAAGVLGTLVMDSMNDFFARSGLLSKIDVATIGRMVVGWTRGRFQYRDPGEITKVANEKAIGYAAHYSIGVVLAFVYVLGWDILVGGPASPIWALVYGVATTAISLFVVFPSMGLGPFGKRSPEGIKSPLSSLANHFFFGVGLAIVVALM